MKKQIILNKTKVEYTLRKSRNSTNVRLAVYTDGRVLVSAPKFVPQILINRFIKQKADWLVGKLEYFKSLPSFVSSGHKRGRYLKYKDQALVLAKDRLEYFNQFYNFKYGRVSIRNQKTRWGSCSKKGNLNFNYKIVLLKPEFADYVIIHELCHLAEFNHSVRFWELVSKQSPNYKLIVKALKNSTY